jgi:hypothetical protein
MAETERRSRKFYFGCRLSDEEEEEGRGEEKEFYLVTEGRESFESNHRKCPNTTLPTIMD